MGTRDSVPADTRVVAPEARVVLAAARVDTRAQDPVVTRADPRERVVTQVQDRVVAIRVPDPGTDHGRVVRVDQEGRADLAGRVDLAVPAAPVRLLW